MSFLNSIKFVIKSCNSISQEQHSSQTDFIRTEKTLLGCWNTEIKINKEQIWFIRDQFRSWLAVIKVLRLQRN